MKEKVSFHHFKNIGTLCVIAVEGSEVGRFGLAFQHESDKVFNRPLGRRISEGRARKGRVRKGRAGSYNSGICNLQEIKKVISYLREEMPVSLGRQEAPRYPAQSSEQEKNRIRLLKFDLIHNLVYNRFTGQQDQ